MKKPKITKGVWENYEDSIRVFENPESRGYIEICEIDQDWDDSRANAKAISAVPEMIDALIDMVIVAERDEWDEATTGRQLILKQAKQALKKAGCES